MTTSTSWEARYESLLLQDFRQEARGNGEITIYGYERKDRDFFRGPLLTIESHRVVIRSEDGAQRAILRSGIGEFYFSGLQRPVGA